MFARWRAERREAKRRRRMDGIIEKLVEAGDMAFEEGCRLQVPINLFDHSDDLKQFVVAMTAKAGVPVRANAAHGLVTFYNDDGDSDGKEIVRVNVEK